MIRCVDARKAPARRLRKPPNVCLQQAQKQVRCIADEGEAGHHRIAGGEGLRDLHGAKSLGFYGQACTIVTWKSAGNVRQTRHQPKLQSGAGQGDGRCTKSPAINPS